MVTSMYSPSLESGISVQLLIPMQPVNTKNLPKQQKKASKGAEPRKSVSLKNGLNRTVSAPAAIGTSLQAYFHVESVKNGKGRFRNAIRVRGQDFLSNVLKPTPTTDDVPGKVLTEVYLNPSELGETRLAKFAELYEKFLFTDFKVKYTPAVGSTTYGQLVFAADRDISDSTPNAGEAGLRKICSYEGAETGTCWMPVTMDVPLEQPDTGYYTSVNSVEDRLAYQGQIYVASVLPCEVSAGAAIGSLWIEYDCLLFVPQLEDMEVRSMFRQTAISPTAADALLPFAPQSGPSRIDAGVPVSLRNPPSGSVTVCDLAEGLYQLIQEVAQNQAGLVQFGVPTLRAKEPAPASAPQPQVTTISSSQANAVGTKSIFQFLLNIPKGGCEMSQNMTFVTGLGANSISKMLLNRLDGPVSSEAFLNYFGGPSL